MFARVRKLAPSADGAAMASVVLLAAATLYAASTETNFNDAQLISAVKSHVGDYTRLSEALVRQFNEKGLLVIPNILSAAELQDARLSVQDLIAEGRMQGAGDDMAAIRHDSTCFIRASDGTSDAATAEDRARQELGGGLLRCISLLRGATTHLEALGYNRSSNHRIPLQCQLALYAGDGQASYVAHRDAADDDDLFQVGLLSYLRAKDYRQRSITAILYLNTPDWDSSPSADGGRLTCYEGAHPNDVLGSTATNVRYVNPSGGTLVLFDSRYLLHEVSPSYRGRVALTLWILGDKAVQAVPKIVPTEVS
jgi:hypothetical protein